MMVIYRCAVAVCSVPAVRRPVAASGVATLPAASVLPVGVALPTSVVLALPAAVILTLPAAVVLALPRLVALVSGRLVVEVVEVHGLAPPADDNEGSHGAARQQTEGNDNPDPPLGVGSLRCFSPRGTTCNGDERAASVATSRSVAAGGRASGRRRHRGGHSRGGHRAVGSLASGHLRHVSLAGAHEVTALGHVGIVASLVSATRSGVALIRVHVSADFGVLLEKRLVRLDETARAHLERLGTHPVSLSPLAVLASDLPPLATPSVRTRRGALDGGTPDGVDVRRAHLCVVRNHTAGGLVVGPVVVVLLIPPRLSEVTDNAVNRIFAR
eukprot:Rhum_TRINITY_DN15275_c5_g1::Rhum_TRINITY_DN15275_c5_g1_i12::g.148538::m.148538